MQIRSNEPLSGQLGSVLGSDPDLIGRFIALGPLELHRMFSRLLGPIMPARALQAAIDPLGLYPKGGTLHRPPTVGIPCPDLPYSQEQLKAVIKQLADENSNAMLTLDLPDVGGQATNLSSLAHWFGNPDQGEALGKVHPGLLNLNLHIPDRLPRLVEVLGTVSASPQWRIRYLDLPAWGANLTFEDQQQEVERRGFSVPSAIADAWSMLVATCFIKQCGSDFYPRRDHIGRTRTVFDGSPIVIYNSQYRFGLDISVGVSEDNPSTYVCCEIPPLQLD